MPSISCCTARWCRNPCRCGGRDCWNGSVPLGGGPCPSSASSTCTRTSRSGWPPRELPRRLSREPAHRRTRDGRCARRSCCSAPLDNEASAAHVLEASAASCGRRPARARPRPDARPGGDGARALGGGAPGFLAVNVVAGFSFADTPDTGVSFCHLDRGAEAAATRGLAGPLARLARSRCRTVGNVTDRARRRGHGAYSESAAAGSHRPRRTVRQHRRRRAGRRHGTAARAC